MFSTLIAILVLILASAILPLPVAVFVIGHKRKWRWGWRFTSLIPLTAVIVFFYFLFRTPESFYHDEYRIITQTNFPESAEIQYSTTSSESFHGDYASAFLVDLEPKDIRSLTKNVQSRNFEKGKVVHVLSEELDYIESKSRVTKYAEVYTINDYPETFIVAFSHDKKSVMFYHSAG